MIVSPMLNYDPKKDIINPKRCQICVQRLEEKKSDVIFPNRKSTTLIKGIILGTLLLAKLWLIDKLFPKHVGLPHLDLTVHKINFLGWMSQGGYSEPILLLALF